MRLDVTKYLSYKSFLSDDEDDSKVVILDKARASGKSEESFTVVHGELGNFEFLPGKIEKTEKIFNRQSLLDDP